MELKELIKYARDNRCSDLHITAGEAVAVRKYGELELLDITPSIEETEEMIFSILGDEDIQNVQAGKDIDVASTDESGGRLRINIYHQRRNLAVFLILLYRRLKNWDIQENFFLSLLRKGLVLFL